MKIALILALIFAPAILAGQSSEHNTNRKVVRPAAHVGYASYYANFFNGRKTASGERFSNASYTAASKELPLGSRVKVTNLKNNRSVVVRVTDRGPYVKGRSIDLSRRAAEDIGMITIGVTKVNIIPLG
jgi:rare lipoprotein A